MTKPESAKKTPEIESVQRIEPARLDDVPEAISNGVRNQNMTSLSGATNRLPVLGSPTS